MSKRDAIIYWTGFGVVVVLLIISPLVLPPFWSRFVTDEREHGPIVGAVG